MEATVFAVYYDHNDNNSKNERTYFFKVLAYEKQKKIVSNRDDINQTFKHNGRVFGIKKEIPNNSLVKGEIYRFEVNDDNHLNWNRDETSCQYRTNPQKIEIDKLNIFGEINRTNIRSSYLPIFRGRVDFDKKTAYLENNYHPHSQHKECFFIIDNFDYVTGPFKIFDTRIELYSKKLEDSFFREFEFEFEIKENHIFRFPVIDFGNHIVSLDGEEINNFFRGFLSLDFFTAKAAESSYLEEHLFDFTSFGDILEDVIKISEIDADNIQKIYDSIEASSRISHINEQHTKVFLETIKDNKEHVYNVLASYKSVIKDLLKQVLEEDSNYAKVHIANSIKEYSDFYKDKLPELFSNQDNEKELSYKIQLEDSQKNILSLNEIINNQKTEIEELKNSVKNYKEIGYSQFEIDTKTKEYKELLKQSKIAQDDYDRWVRSVTDKKAEVDKLDETIVSKNVEILDLETKIKNETHVLYGEQFENVRSEAMKVIPFIEPLFHKLKSTDNLSTKEIIYEKNDILDLNILFEKIKEYLKSCRYKISDDNLKNIILSILLNKMTVFSGKPGCGKTVLAEILSKFFTPLAFEFNSIISVAQGWTSQKDLIGYKNPLNNEVESAENDFYNIISQANTYNDILSLVVFDEFNLSQIEHYFNSFISKPEINDEICIHLNGLRIPKEMRFIGTMNFDFSTTILTPRFIERVSIIELENSNEASFREINLDKKDSLFPALDGIKNILKKANDGDTELKLLKYFKEKVSLSTRRQKQIQQYFNLSQGFIEREVAEDYIMMQYILPTINSNDWNKESLKELDEYCKKDLEAPKTVRKIKKILERADRNYGDINYFG